MKRRLLKLGLLLFAGAIINVGVAWGVAAWSKAPAVQIPSSALSFARISDVEKMKLRSFGYDDRKWSRGISASVDGCGIRVKTILDMPNPQLPSELRPHFSSLVEIATETASGWPCMALQGARFNFGAGEIRENSLGLADAWRPQENRILPLGIVWLGFAINTFFYAVILWSLVAARLVLPRYRRLRRIRRGLCPACAYPVGTSDKCTECGKPVTTVGG